MCACFFGSPVACAALSGATRGKPIKMGLNWKIGTSWFWPSQRARAAGRRVRPSQLRAAVAMKGHYFCSLKQAHCEPGCAPEATFQKPLLYIQPSTPSPHPPLLTTHPPLTQIGIFIFGDVINITLVSLGGSSMSVGISYTIAA